jgi:Na+/H+-dicarboxylate symporter
MSLTARILIALVLGIGSGVAISLTDSSALRTIAFGIEPVGTLFINAIRMTVIPLVVGCLVVGVSSAPDARSVGRVGRGAIVFFVVTLFLSALFAALLAPPLLRLIPIDPAASAALRASVAGGAAAATESAQQIPSFTDWVVALIPTNPVQAAASGAILPLIVFSVLFGLAVSRIRLDRRASLVAVFQGIADASLTLVRWILELAPIGVFALAVPLAVRMGIAAAGALVGYVVLTAVLSVLFMGLVLYPLAATLGRTPLREFARAALPAQAVAFSARSSLASLPAMIESARDALKLPPAITGFFLPLAASTYRVGGGLGIVCGVMWIAALYGITVTPAQIASVVVTVVLTTFSVPGVPGGSIIVMVPVLLAAGLPIEGVGILLGADTIPDMFRTTANVTGDMSAATVLGARLRSAEGVDAGTPDIDAAADDVAGSNVA